MTRIWSVFWPQGAWGPKSARTWPSWTPQLIRTLKIHIFSVHFEASYSDIWTRITTPKKYKTVDHLNWPDVFFFFFSGVFCFPPSIRGWLRNLCSSVQRAGDVIFRCGFGGAVEDIWLNMTDIIWIQSYNDDKDWRCWFLPNNGCEVSQRSLTLPGWSTSYSSQPGGEKWSRADFMVELTI